MRNCSMERGLTASVGNPSQFYIYIYIYIHLLPSPLAWEGNSAVFPSFFSLSLAMVDRSIGK
jgi:hypothetical protein